MSEEIKQFSVFVYDGQGDVEKVPKVAEIVVEEGVVFLNNSEGNIIQLWSIHGFTKMVTQ